MFEEFLKCEKDFVYFTEEYLKIQHPTRNLISFTLYDYQKRLVKTYNDNQFVVFKKFRQGGFSTLTILYSLWQCMFYEGKKILHLFKTDREACYASGFILDQAVKNLPEQFKLLLGKCNTHTKEFQITGSQLEFLSSWHQTPTTPLTDLFIHEAAYIMDIEKHWQNLYPYLDINGKCFVFSTPNGNKNWFANLYHDAKINTNQFHVFDCSYLEHPDYKDGTWIEQTKKNLGEKCWQSEFECQFI